MDPQRGPLKSVKTRSKINLFQTYLRDPLGEAFWAPRTPSGPLPRAIRGPLGAHLGGPVASKIEVKTNTSKCSFLTNPPMFLADFLPPARSQIDPETGRKRPAVKKRRLNESKSPAKSAETEAGAETGPEPAENGPQNAIPKSVKIDPFSSSFFEGSSRASWEGSWGDLGRLWRGLGGAMGKRLSTGPGGGGPGEG